MEFILIARKLQEKYSTPESVETLFSGKALSALGKTDAEFETEYCRQNPLSFSCSELAGLLIPYFSMTVIMSGILLWLVINCLTKSINSL